MRTLLCERQRCTYALSRAVLRALVGRYTGHPARDVVFEHNRRGTPRMSGPASLQFDLADSGDLAVCAFTRNCDIGVDIEYLRPLGGGPEGMARCVFAPADIAELLSLSPEERLAALFRCWTRKEAYIKAAGEGMVIPLDSFHVSRGRDDGARMVQPANEAEAPGSWTVHDLEPASGCVGAVAYRGAPRPVMVFDPLRADALLGLLAR